MFEKTKKSHRDSKYQQNFRELNHTIKSHPFLIFIFNLGIKSFKLFFVDLKKKHEP